MTLERPDPDDELEDDLERYDLVGDGVDEAAGADLADYVTARIRELAPETESETAARWGYG